MEIKVEVKLEKNRSELTRTKDPSRFEAKLKSKAKHNLANNELVALLASEFQVEQKSIKIVKGQKSIRKVLEIKNANK